MAAATDARTNGNGATSDGNGASAPVPVPRIVLTQQSVSGTERGRDGIQLPDDYVRELQDPTRRVEIFEEMGNDDAVATAIDGRCQDIYAANWQLQTEDKSTRGTEILEFCEDNIYRVIDDLLRLLGREPLQFGFVCIEPVYAWSDSPFSSSVTRGPLTRPTRNVGERRIYLEKLAHILPSAVTAFKISERGDLQYLYQNVYVGNANVDRDIPADKLLIRVFNKKGDDYYGNPPTRQCYGLWMHKKQHVKLALLHHDRFAVGVPVVTAPEQGWTGVELQQAATFAKYWRSGAENFAGLPYGAKMEVVTADGGMSTEMMEWVKHANLQIAKVFTTAQTELGNTDHGSRALGETFDEQRQGSVQADCEDIANIINNGLIIPLVKYNFGEQETYPTFAPSGKVRAGTDIEDKLTKALAAGVFKPRAEDQVWYRDVRELPPVDLTTIQQEEEDAAAQAAAIADAQTTPTDPANPSPAGSGSQSDAPRTSDRPPQPALRIAASQAGSRESALVRHLSVMLADGAPEPAVPGQSSHRTPDYSTWEARVLRPDVLIRDLDVQAMRLTGEWQDVLTAIDDDLTRQATSLAEQGVEALANAVRGESPALSVPNALRRRLRALGLDAATRAREYGSRAVRSEVLRQISPDGIGPQRAPEIAMYSARPRGLGAFMRGLLQLARGEEKTPEQIRLEAEVDRAVEDEIARREASARTSVGVILSQKARAPAAELVAAVASFFASAFQSLSTGRTTQNVQRVVNVGFGIGRTEEAQAINADASTTSTAPSAPSGPAEGLPAGTSGGGGGRSRSGLRNIDSSPIELVAKHYSAVMDLGTCDQCAMWDGAEFPIDYPEDNTGVQCPNPRCHGGYDQCRCVWIYVTANEARPNVPASKGPVPLSQIVDDKIAALSARMDAAFAEQKATALAQLAAKPDATPQPISIAVTIEAPKPGSKRVEMVKADGSKITADVTET